MRLIAARFRATWFGRLPGLWVAVLLCGLASSAAGESGSASLGPADRSAIRGVIETQIAAFRRDDGNAAFALASPEIQRAFRAPEIFMAMVRRGYQPVYRPRQVEFRDIVVLDGVPTQEVHVVAPDGRPVIALYPMQRQPDGSWRIRGCYLLNSPDRST